MSNKLFPLILMVGGLFYAFRDKVELPDFSPDKPAVVVVETRVVSEDMKVKVGGLVKIVQAANLNKDLKMVMSNLWAGNGDVWKEANVSFNSDKLESFNGDLLKSFSILYPDIVGSVPGFSDEVGKLFADTIGEYPTPLTKEKAKQVSELSYAISWSFTQ